MTLTASAETLTTESSTPLVLLGYQWLKLQMCKDVKVTSVERVDYVTIYEVW